MPVSNCYCRVYCQWYCIRAFIVKKCQTIRGKKNFYHGASIYCSPGGQILFGSNDGYLYFMMGDGGGTGDPYNFSQDKKSLLGKIMRLNVPSKYQHEIIMTWFYFLVCAIFFVISAGYCIIFLMWKLFPVRSFHLYLIYL